jgi:geranylgeranyl reductase family protein
MTERFDVVVVGAGPAGATAARVAAERGARVLLLDAARFPRYKTCGGGLVGASLAELPPEVRALVERRVTTVAFSWRGRRPARVRSARPFLAMVSRDRFDAALVDAAVRAGARFRDHVRVRSVDSTGDGVRLRFGDDSVDADVVVGADGSAGVVGRYVGVRIARVDLGLELELADDEGSRWAETVQIDWGRAPGSYGWVFPKDGRLSVGVGQRKGDGPGTRAYLERLVAGLGLEGRRVERSSGHLIQWREPGSPLRRDRVLVAGDAAGLVEPWTREGISFALRSGRMAGEAAAAAVRSPDPAGALAGYERAVTRTLEPEQRAGAALLHLFERWPGPVHLTVSRTGIGAAAFIRFCRGTLALERVLRHPLAGPVLRLVAR